MDISELDAIAVHAIHALPPEEAARFERALPAELEPALASFRRVAAVLLDGLPDVVPEPSPELWDRIREASGIQETTHRGTSSFYPGSRRPDRRWS